MSEDGCTPLWDFQCKADRLADGQYRVVVTTASGRRYERTGFNALWELIRMFHSNLREEETAEALHDH